jgi:hypothetical protein
MPNTEEVIERLNSIDCRGAWCLAHPQTCQLIYGCTPQPTRLSLNNSATDVISGEGPNDSPVSTPESGTPPRPILNGDSGLDRVQFSEDATAKFKRLEETLAQTNNRKLNPIVMLEALETLFNSGLYRPTILLSRALFDNVLDVNFALDKTTLTSLLRAAELRMNAYHKLELHSRAEETSLLHKTFLTLLNHIVEM